MALAIVLAGKGLATDRTHEWALVGVRAEMAAQVVGAREAFGAEMALKGGWVLLGAAIVAAIAGAAFWIDEIQNVFALV